ncbi:MAG: ABC transporter permease [Propionibacteriaceae bacterium]|nr:ABC transporter permease [Propionibacteriaceae bacterium]
MADEALFTIAENLRRAAFAMIGVAVGVAAILAVAGLTASASAAVLLGFNTDQARRIDVSPSSESAQSTLILTDDQQHSLRNLPGVVAAGTIDQIGAVSISTLPFWIDPDGAQDTTLLGVSSDVVHAAGCELLTGRWLLGADGSHYSEVVLGDGLAELLGVTSAADGRIVYIASDPYAVTGVVHCKYSGINLTDSAMILYLAADGDRGPSAPEHLLISTESAWTNQVRSAVGLLLDPNQTGSVQVSGPPDYAAIREAVAGDINGLYLALGGVALLVATIGIVNTRLMAVIERVPEIGLRRALGATRTAIGVQFLLESAGIGLVGGLIGTAMGLATVVLVSLSQSWPPTIDLRLAGLAPLAGLLLGSIAGAYPAWRASRFEPVAALRAAG